jgi:hypothetical protein
MSIEGGVELGDELSGFRERCMAAVNYAAQNEFTLSYAEYDGPLAVPALEIAIALAVAGDYPHFLTEVEDPLERGRALLREFLINPPVADLDDYFRMDGLAKHVDEYFLAYQEWQVSSNQVA